MGEGEEGHREAQEAQEPEDGPVPESLLGLWVSCLGKDLSEVRKESPSLLLLLLLLLIRRRRMRSIRDSRRHCTREREIM
jgi:hypothetical protein